MFNSFQKCLNLSTCQPKKYFKRVKGEDANSMLVKIFGKAISCMKLFFNWWRIDNFPEGNNDRLISVKLSLFDLKFDINLNSKSFSSNEFSKRNKICSEYGQFVFEVVEAKGTLSVKKSSNFLSTFQITLAVL